MGLSIVALCRYLLTQHPVVEAKIVAELDDLDLLVTADRPQPRKLTYGDLNKLVYLQAVVKVTPPPPSPGILLEVWGPHIMTSGQSNSLTSYDEHEIIPASAGCCCSDCSLAHGK